MISYQIYKVIHLASIFIFLSGAAVMLTTSTKNKFWTITTGIASFFIILGGMGLMARLGGGFQPWIIAKLVIWFIISALGHMVAKRFASQGKLAYVITMVLAVLAASFAIYKPMF